MAMGGNKIISVGVGIFVIKMNVLPRIMFLFQTVPILTTDIPFK